MRMSARLALLPLVLAALAGCSSLPFFQRSTASIPWASVRGLV